RSRSRTWSGRSSRLSRQSVVAGFIVVLPPVLAPLLPMVPGSRRPGRACYFLPRDPAGDEPPVSLRARARVAVKAPLIVATIGGLYATWRALRRPARVVGKDERLRGAVFSAWA